MAEPTSPEVDEEIAKLQDFRDRLSQKQSAFGDDHEEALDAQLSVLEERLDLDEVYARYDDGPENVASHAQDAARWLEGEDDKEAPSQSWEESSHLFHAKD